ncbi:MAG: NAD(P)-binding domain-containing protein [Pyrinomonadaceae bacterium]
MEMVPKFDLVIIGAGPAGLSAAAAAAEAGLNYIVFERGLLGHTIYNYPVGRTVFSTTEELEMRPGALQPAREKPTREELLSHYVRFTLENELRINSEEEVTAAERGADGEFQVTSSKGIYLARRILFTTGAMANLRRLGVPGEDLPKVYHRFEEPYPFVRKKVMVIGGGNSAAEAALFLAEDGAETTLTIWPSDWENRDPKKGAIKHWVRTPLEKLIGEGRLNVQFFKQVLQIEPDQVVIEMDDGQVVKIPNDSVFVLIGADADYTLMKSLGIETVSEGLLEFPVYDPETFETNVPGIFVAGHFTRARHIKDAIGVPRRIMPGIARTLLQNELSEAR